ncbi:hypothetical protein ABFS82_04G011200 [Erythranthe guttata]|uniref:uncharacterized protein LOC105954806 n=1 Tax=Erythranthe guttata TaxID=4155 RepID=UPI00064DD78A|nr:PREDICTED: uncharacterized protein LOC105954806 [Erythranthe guttata]|eukprot:XP_012833945.1 PREDICTED: uncharacterized protein LOC105954806 [Erythranthe guttata]
MSSNGGYSAAPPRQGGDRFYNPPAVRRHQFMLLEQQMMQRQLLQQQHQQQQLQRRPMERPESSSEAEAGRRNDGDDSSPVVPLYPQRYVGPGPTFNFTNLDRLMESVTPYVQARHLPEVDARGRRTREVDSLPFFYLEDLWESFCERSVYGAGVPLVLNGKDRFKQYYVPFLSGIQLYIDPSQRSSRARELNEEVDAESYRLTNSGGSSNSVGDRRTLPIFNLNMQRPNRVSLEDNYAIGSVTSGYDTSTSPGRPSFQFLEDEQPRNRRPLSDKISILASRYPELIKCRSCDLLPASWICVAWYPIYRIPMGPTLKDLDASFLSFHSLSTQPRLRYPPRFHAANTRVDRGFVDPMARISLPGFGLASYKLKGSIVSPSGPYECEQETSLLHAADNWLRCLDVALPDYDFFRSHYPRQLR